MTFAIILFSLTIIAPTGTSPIANAFLLQLLHILYNHSYKTPFYKNLFIYIILFIPFLFIKANVDSLHKESTFIFL